MNVRKTSTRVSGALFLVISALLLASMACYSGQIPGLFELTPFHTQTAIPTTDAARFTPGDYGFTSRESTGALFSLTFLPEPLERSLTNSKSFCEPNVAARVLYAGVAGDGGTYYLVECSGAAGWVSDQRLAGPLKFNKGDLALTIVQEGADKINLLDVTTFEPPAFSFMVCQPGSIVAITDIEAADVNDTGVKEIFYQVECPQSNPGWLTNLDLMGPLEINVGDFALAINANGEDDSTEYRLASEPVLVTDDNAVVSDSCIVGSVVEAQEIQLVEGTIYYKVSCDDIDGWTTHEHFVGPLQFDVGNNVVIYMQPVSVFADQLTTEMAEEGTTTPAEDGEETEEELATDEAAEAGTTDERKIVQYTLPLYLTENPGVIIFDGEDANVVGQCTSGNVAHIDEYVGLETVYYRVSCDECVESETTEAGETICTAYETRNGWTKQENFQGPIAFVPGQQARYRDTGDVDENGNPVALLPNEPVYVVGSNTQFSGRCPLEDGVEILSVRLEKDRTRDSFTFYFEVQCQGDAASYEEVTEGGTTRYEATFNTGGADTITGWVNERALEPFE